MNILGIDQSLRNTGIVVLKNGNFVHSGTIKSKHKMIYDIDRLIRIRFIISKIISTYKIDVVTIEGFGFGARGRSVFELGGLFYLLYDLFKQMRKKVLIIQPTMLKKFVTGKGNCDKSLMLKEVYKRYKFDTKNDNIADAFGLAKIGEAFHNHSMKLISFQKEVIMKLKGA